MADDLDQLQQHIDETVARREDRLQAIDPQRLRVINFDGREFVVDAQGRELRAVDVPTERYHISDDIRPIR